MSVDPGTENLLYFFILLTLLGGVMVWFFWMDTYLKRVRIAWGTFINREDHPRLFIIIFTLQLLGIVILVLCWLMLAFHLLAVFVPELLSGVGRAV